MVRCPDAFAADRTWSAFFQMNAVFLPLYPWQPGHQDSPSRGFPRHEPLRKELTDGEEDVGPENLTSQFRTVINCGSWWR